MSNVIREILVLHHSHLDVGFTHSQAIVWEMHREYLDQALDFLDATADWPELSRPKWTCEVTAPVVRWLNTALAANVERFRRHVQSGRLAVCAMRHNYSPLLTAPEWSRQLTAMHRLRQQLGARINTAIQHDVNGVPWPVADLLLDAGVDLFLMGTNRHLGNPVGARPGIFRWQSPSGRELRVMNGNQYTMFDQIFLTWEQSVEAMHKGWAQYDEHLRKLGYPHDFLYLTTTASPEMWDNSPPNTAVARLIRKWNDLGNKPAIRYVTTEDLCHRISQLPSESLPKLAGDWTDYWNFGCASTANDVRRARAARRTLSIAGLIASSRETVWPPAVRRVATRAWNLLDLYQEHTWSYWDTASDGEPCHIQNTLKSAVACESGELANYLLTNELEALAGNPSRAEAPEYALLVNPAPVARAEYVAIPSAWRKPGPRLRCQNFLPPTAAPVEVCGPVEVPAFGWRRVPLEKLQPLPADERVFGKDLRTGAASLSFTNVRYETHRAGFAIIESPRHRLTYDPASGRILGLYDKVLNWEVTPAGADYELFEFIRERPDSLVDGRREAYYKRDLEEEKYDQCCWKSWKAVRERATRVIDCRVRREAGAVTLERTFEAPGTGGLCQRITFRADSPLIAIEVELDKLAYPEPEGIYFVLPVNLPAGWRCHFDTAGLAVELDAQQLPGACRNWLTAESYVALHGADRGVTLFCPDAPMVQAGGFQFGPPLERVLRPPNPLLLAWPLNNYWDTNFPLVQPGRIRLRYGLATHGAFDPVLAAQQAAVFCQPLIVHPAFEGMAEAGSLLQLEGEGAMLLEIQPDESAKGVLAYLINLDHQEVSARLSLPGLTQATVINPLQETISPAEISGDSVVVKLPPRRVTILQIINRREQEKPEPVAGDCARK